jgi:hypothetical protein
VFPEVESPSLVPEEINEETPLPAAAAEVTPVAGEPTLTERVKITEHFLAVEYIPLRAPATAPRRRFAEAA